MTGIHIVYIVLAVIFACFLGYMFWWNKKDKTPPR